MKKVSKKVAAMADAIAAITLVGEFDERFLVEMLAARERWDAARAQFDALVLELSKLVGSAGDKLKVLELVVDLKRVESAWGDYPQTRQIAAILGLDEFVKEAK